VTTCGPRTHNQSTTHVVTRSGWRLHLGQNREYQLAADCSRLEAAVGRDFESEKPAGVDLRFGENGHRSNAGADRRRQQDGHSRAGGNPGKAKQFQSHRAVAMQDRRSDHARLSWRRFENWRWSAIARTPRDETTKLIGLTGDPRLGMNSRVGRKTTRPHAADRTDAARFLPIHARRQDDPPRKAQKAGLITKSFGPRCCTQRG